MSNIRIWICGKWVRERSALHYRGYDREEIVRQRDICIGHSLTEQLRTHGHPEDALCKCWRARSARGCISGANQRQRRALKQRSASVRCRTSDRTVVARAYNVHCLPDAHNVYKGCPYSIQTDEHQESKTERGTKRGHTERESADHTTRKRRTTAR